jgi:hypothetical protein
MSGMKAAMTEQSGITRRGVLRGAVFGAAALAIGGSAVASPLFSGVVGATDSATGIATKPATSGISFAQGTFTPLVGQPFSVQVDGSWRTVVLDEVVAHTRPGHGESFSLVFDGMAPAFSQATYQVKQASLGQFAMFVAPVNQPNRMQRYESVINHRQPH